LLHAYANAEHEQRIREEFSRRAPKVLVSISSEVSPKFREYERTNTTVTNAYVKPIVDRYLRHLDEALATRGIRNDLFVMQSNGAADLPRPRARVPRAHYRVRPCGGNPHERHRGEGRGPRPDHHLRYGRHHPPKSAPSTTARPRSCPPSRSTSCATLRRVTLRRNARAPALRAGRPPRRNDPCRTSA
jgi:hypothetical protein